VLGGKIDQLSEELIDAKNRADKAELELASVRNELSAIHASRGWRLTRLFQKITKVLFPTGSLRRKIAGVLLSFLKKVFEIATKAKSYLLNSFHWIEAGIFRLPPKKKRKINRSSKKIVYIGHSYHNKTKSTKFLINYLKKIYDVKVILDESWRGTGEPFPDLSFINDSYLGVILFQNLPEKDMIKKINNDNIIFFPMYDATSSWNYDKWHECKNMKIMNFSSTLHEKLSKWGFESDYVQYFPKPTEFIKGKKDEAFFWQRLTFININTIAKVLGKKKIKLHIHKAIDPEQEFIQPTKELENKYEITYSDWFETRDEMWNMIKEKAIYIAPRQYEGIGLSFLEAMAMGKAVVAANNPTMNEYIENNKTGYLFDLSNPKEINLSNVEKVQKNTYNFMCDGYKMWEKDKHRIIEFIESE
jgi:glycosyltransferase involved in cell wall biosynthesis